MSKFAQGLTAGYLLCCQGDPAELARFHFAGRDTSVVLEPADHGRRTVS